MRYPLWFIEQMRRDAGEFDDWEDAMNEEPELEISQPKTKEVVSDLFPQPLPYPEDDL